jgi:hypothetical protein
LVLDPCLTASTGRRGRTSSSRSAHYLPPPGNMTRPSASADHHIG